MKYKLLKGHNNFVISFEIIQTYLCGNNENENVQMDVWGD